MKERREEGISGRRREGRGRRTPGRVARGRARAGASTVGRVEAGVRADPGAQDSSGHRRIFDRGDEAHPIAAARAIEHVEAHRPLEQDGPRQATLTPRIVGGGEVRRYWRRTPVTGVASGGRRWINSTSALLPVGSPSGQGRIDSAFTVVTWLPVIPLELGPSWGGHAPRTISPDARAAVAS